MSKETNQFNLSLEGYEGPIDLLLDLAKKQKVNLSNISIFKLAEQYLVFIQKFKDLHIEIAADYLVMAAWLTYLKSRLLLPKDDNEDESSDEGENKVMVKEWCIYADRKLDEADLVEAKG